MKCIQCYMEQGFPLITGGLYTTCPAHQSMMGGWPYVKACKSCGDPIGPTSWFDYCGPCMGKANTPAVEPAVKMSDTDIEDQIRERVDTWDRERQIVAYKYLHAQGMRVGASLDHELSELRHRRKQEEKDGV